MSVYFGSLPFKTAAKLIRNFPDFTFKPVSQGLVDVYAPEDTPHLRGIFEEYGSTDITTSEKKAIVCGTIPEYTSYRFFIEAAQLLPGVVRGSVRNSRRQVLATEGFTEHVRLFIDKWNESHKGEAGVSKIEWAYGITTIPSRWSLFVESFYHLKSAGFDDPVVYVDDSHVNSPAYADFTCSVVYRGRNSKTYSHWLLSLLDLYTRNPAADRYVLFQDDVSCCINLRNYLDRCEFPHKGYWNLFTGTFSVNHARTTNEEIAKAADSVGFIPSNQKGHGAQALVFDNEGVIKLFQCPSAFQRMWDPAKRHCSVDGYVCHALKSFGFTEYIHNPSLLQHIGTASSMGHGIQPLSSLYVGSSFDAMDFLKVSATAETSPGLGSLISWALGFVGITPDRVSNWLGAPCNCEERKRKLDELTAWAKRCLLGRLTDAKKRLIDLLSKDEV